MKDTKRQFKMFSFFDFDGITAHMEKMAAEGWMLEQSTNRFWFYRRTEPKKLKFAVTYFPKASEFDPHPTEELQTFNEFCQAAGWKPAASTAQMQIYYNENENPVPLETDPMVQVNTIHTAMKKNFIPSYFVMIGISLMIIVMYVMRIIANPVSGLSSNSVFFIISSYFMLFMITAVELGQYYLWRKKALARAEDGDSIPSGKTAMGFQIFTLVVVFAMLLVYLFSSISIISPLFMLVMFVVFGSSGVIAVFVKEFLRKRNVPRRVNMIVTFASAFIITMAMAVVTVFVVIKYNIKINPKESQPVGTYMWKGMEWDIYNDDVPLRLEDYMTTDYTDYSVQNRPRSSVFLTQHRVSQEATINREGIPELHYELTEVHADIIYNTVFEDIFYDIDESKEDKIPREYRAQLIEQNDPAWQADKVYREYFGGEYTDKWLICWNNKIVELRFYTGAQPDDTQKAIIGERLKNI